MTSFPEDQDEKHAKKLHKAPNTKKDIKKDLGQGSSNNQAGTQAPSCNKPGPAGPATSPSGSNHPDFAEPQPLPGDPEVSVDPLKFWNSLGHHNVQLLISLTYIDTLTTQICSNQRVKHPSANYRVIFPFKIGLG